MPRVLTPEEMSRLGKIAENLESRTQPPRYFNLDEKRAVLAAHKQGLKTVHFNKRTFTIKPHPADPMRVFIMPLNGVLAPCGWINLTDVEKGIEL